MTTYPAGVEVRFAANQTSGAAPTLDCGGGALPIRDALASAAVPSGFLESGYVYTVRSNGTYWLLQEPAVGAAGEKFLSNVSVGTPLPTVVGNAGVIVPVVRASSVAGLYSGTYTSGITATGSTSQTCILTITNGGCTGATATVALTGTNTIAGSTALVVTAAGTTCTTAPTTATAGNGTATCSGTATIATVIGYPIAATGFYINDNAAPITWSLPTITSSLIGLQVCTFNGQTRTGIQTIKAPASTYIDKDGANGTAAGTLVLGGALSDAACFVATSTTQYKLFLSSGTATNN